MFKVCSSCKNKLSIDRFSTRKGSKDGFRSQCKSCRQVHTLKWAKLNKNKVNSYLKKWRSKNKQRLSIGIKQWRLKNPDLARIRDKTNNQRQRARIKILINQYLSSHSCVDCGNSDIMVLEFDHVKGIKKRNISGLSSLKAVKFEISKCQIRCANCHKIRHYEENLQCPSL